MTKPELRSNHLFTLSLTVDPDMTDVGETPYGRRRIAASLTSLRIGLHWEVGVDSRSVPSHGRTREARAAISTERASLPERWARSDVL